MNPIIKKAIEQRQNFLGCETDLLSLESALDTVQEEFALASELGEDEQGQAWLKASGLSREVKDQTERLNAVGDKLGKAREAYDTAHELLELWPDVLTKAVEKFIAEGGTTEEVIEAIGFDLSQLNPYKKEIKEGLRSRKITKAKARFEEMKQKFPEAPSDVIGDLASQIAEAEKRAIDIAADH